MRVEIADTFSKQEQGLMFRTSMSEDAGMIFLFKHANKLSFWGVNTFIPLDIAFINPQGYVTEIRDIRPMSDKLVRSSEICNIAIEANIGYFAQNNINAGDKISFERISDKLGIVNFHKPIKTSQQLISKKDDLPFDKSKKITLPNTNDQPNSIFEPLQEDANLPVISLADLNGILEDSYDQDGQIAEQPPENEPMISPEEQENAPQETPAVPDKEYPQFSTPSQAINWAQQNKEVVHIWYTTKGGRDIERDVEPHGTFIADSTANHIVVTFDETIGDIRAFIEHKIMFFSFVGREFKPKFVIKA